MLGTSERSSPRTPVRSRNKPMPAAPTDPPPAGAVLIVEDDRVNRTLLARHVERLGRRVVTADHGRQALDILRETPCDLVLLDVMMPEMDGHELLGVLKDRH